MIESIVSFLIDKLGPLLVKEIKLLKGVSTEIGWIKDELQIMKAFLRDAESRAESEAVVKEWVAQVRKAAYDIEDVLDEYFLRLAQPPIHRDDKFMGSLRKTMHNITHGKKRHDIANQIQELKTRVGEISKRKDKFGFKMNEQGPKVNEQSPSSSNALSDRVSHRRSSARWTEEADLVGIDDPRNELIGLLVDEYPRTEMIELLVDGQPSLTTISIFGMGGLGKTSLAGIVYDNERVKRHFEAFAWVTVSQTFSHEEIFRSMVKEICEGKVERADAMGKHELMKELKRHLQKKRYVIVLDDLWTKDDWESIKIGLPSGERGSRILVTTRINEVAAACTRTADHVYHLQPLPFEEGWKLFCKEAFQSELEGNCPHILKTLSENIVKKCEGLPLAIVTIGSLLWTKSKTLDEWEKMYDNLGHQIESNSSLTIMNRILLLSYNDLPYYLKPCFLYLSIFPKDYLIRRMRLIQLWIAEGFVERKEGMTLTLEKVANGYLDELINRSLIKVASYTLYETISYCRVHDVVRETVLLKAREENFVTFSNGTVGDETRRLAVCVSENINVPNSDLSHVRTFVMFGKNTWTDSIMKFWLSGFRLLKVLDLEGRGIDEFPSEIVNLFHLRFLSLRKTGIRALPESIGQLENLETLDIQYTNITKLPTSIVKLQHLRHLLSRLRMSDRMEGVTVTQGVGSLRFLQQFGYIKIDQDSAVVIAELRDLTQLKWLGIVELKIENGLGLCTSIAKMTCLSSLAVSSANRGEGLLDLKSLSTPPPPLEQVDLRGRLEELPTWIPSLSNYLVRLTLEDSQLKEDPFAVLGKLPNLMKLKLIGAYNGEELYCEKEGFPRLKSLLLDTLPGLKLVSVKKRAMPYLQKLHISHCGELEKLPDGIEYLCHLKELQFFSVGKALVKSLEMFGGEEHSKIIHVPYIYIC